MMQGVVSGKISDREKAMMMFIHEFGFCEIHHLIKRFGLCRSACYAYMKILQRFGWVNHASSLSRRAGVYYLTAKAIKMLDTDLPCITKIPFTTYRHYGAVLSVYFYLRELYKDAEWITERRLILQKQDNLAGSKTHLPDGVLLMPDHSRIAIEVELTLKARTRLMGILTDYAVDSTFQEVWYFCSPSIISTLQEVVVSLPKIKIHLLGGSCL